MKLIRTLLTTAGVAILTAVGVASAAQTVTVTNPLNTDRPAQSIVLPWAQVAKVLPGAKPDRVLVTDPTGRVLQAQPVHLPGKRLANEQLVFQSNFGPNQSKIFTLSKGNPAPYVPMVYCRWIPERLDDFAWESDKIGFRAYGPALEKVEPASSGVDVWVKRTPALIVNEWYQLAQSINGGYYHVDHGQGCDCYKVGHGQGCGGTALWLNGKRLTTGIKGWQQQRVIANGPIRVVFELTLAPIDVNGVPVTEIKRITLDAGSNFNHFHSTFASPGHEGMPITVAVGVQEHPHRPFQKTFMPNQNWMDYWDAGDSPHGVNNGHIGTAAVFHPGQVTKMIDADHTLLALIPTKVGQTVDFYAGAGWDKSGQFPDKAAWDDYVAATAGRVASPIVVKFDSNGESH